MTTQVTGKGIKKVSRRFQRMAQIYKLFCSPALDFSDNSLWEMYNYESRGKGKIATGLFGETQNGYYVGKKILDITVSMWKEDLGKTLFLEELYRDKFPKWWLDKIFKTEILGWKRRRNDKPCSRNTNKR